MHQEGSPQISDIASESQIRIPTADQRIDPAVLQAKRSAGAPGVQAPAVKSQRLNPGAKAPQPSVEALPPLAISPQEEFPPQRWVNNPADQFVFGLSLPATARKRPRSPADVRGSASRARFNTEPATANTSAATKKAQSPWPYTNQLLRPDSGSSAYTSSDPEYEWC